jgi:hypothetical protein
MIVIVTFNDGVSTGYVTWCQMKNNRMISNNELGKL